MPYIKKEDRLRLEGYFKSSNNEFPQTSGELNYLITQMVLDYLLVQPESYAKYNDAIGALECAKLELYRRMISPYEDVKCAMNGEVYE